MNAALVTGGTGFIGRHLIERLRERGDRVRVLTRDAANLTQLRSLGVEAATGDLTRPQTLDGICNGIDTVFHLAGDAHAWEDYANAGDHYALTLEGTRALLEAAAHARVRRFIFFSSVKAMGEATDDLVDESQAPAPASAYGRARLQTEGLVLAAGKRFGMHACALRLAMVYGPGCKGNLPRMIDAIDRGRFPPLPAVQNKRSMVHVLDVVQAALLAQESRQADGMTYIVTDGQAYSARRIERAIRQALGKRLPRWSLPLGLLRFLARGGDAVGRVRGRRFVFDSDALDKLFGSAWYSPNKIMRELGYRPVYTLEQALPEMLAQSAGQDA